MAFTKTAVVFPEPEPEPEVVEERGSIHLSRSQVLELTRILSFNITSGDDLVRRAKLMSTISIAGAEVIIEPRLLTRLQSRAGRIPLKDFVPRTVISQLNSYCGC
jgi:hypothetical protein